MGGNRHSQQGVDGVLAVRVCFQIWVWEAKHHICIINYMSLGGWTKARLENVMYFVEYTSGRFTP